MYQDNIRPISYYSQDPDNDKEVELPQFELELISKNTLPFIDSDISLVKLKNDGDYLLGSSDTNNFSLLEKLCHLKEPNILLKSYMKTYLIFIIKVIQSLMYMKKYHTVNTQALLIEIL
ncbi:hypothetical protein [Francisella-like endosymbiont]|uniref:hypothetical protein n=1 Tax=Francisella-like endosymbiont TaxID=512373 RepID=UPI00296EEE27